MTSFLDRLEKILAGRKAYPWGAAIGIDRGVIKGIKKNNIPKGETLAIIARVENASITWLIEGKGAPYLVHRANDDIDAADYLTALFEEPNWRVHLVHSADNTAAVLTQPGTFQSPGGADIDYTIVEIVTPIGPAAMAVIQRYAAQPYSLTLDDIRYRRLVTGHMGNMELLGWQDTDGLLARATPADTDAAPAQDDRHVADTPGHYTPDPEHRLLRAWRRMRPDDRTSLLHTAELYADDHWLLVKIAREVDHFIAETGTRLPDDDVTDITMQLYRECLSDPGIAVRDAVRRRLVQ